MKRRLAGAFQKSLWQGLKQVSCGASRESSSGGTSLGAKESDRSLHMGGQLERWWSRGSSGQQEDLQCSCQAELTGLCPWLGSFLGVAPSR